MYLNELMDAIYAGKKIRRDSWSDCQYRQAIFAKDPSGASGGRPRVLEFINGSGKTFNFFIVSDMMADDWEVAE